MNGDDTLRILHLIISEYHRDSRFGRLFNNNGIFILLKYIDDHYKEQLTAADLSKILSLSPFHLLHMFKDATNISLHQYIVQTRVKKFNEKVISQRNTLDAALSCGFYDQSHLIRNFKNTRE